MRYSQPATDDYARAAQAAAPAATPAARPSTTPARQGAGTAARPAAPPAQSNSATAANRDQFAQGMSNQATGAAAASQRVCAGNYPNYGYAASTLPTNNVAVVAKGNNYWYAGGTFYSKGDFGYTICRPPIAGVVPALPIGSYAFVMAQRNYWYYGGAYYCASGTSYEVVAPPTGAVIADLPPDAKEVQINGQTYYDVGGTYYEAVMMNGETCYRVVDLSTH